jgi:hypothetical protein
MPNKTPKKNYAYQKGRRKEYKIRNQLLKEGYEIVQRSAGSHSPIDVFAFHKERKELLLVQSKPDGYKEKKYEEYEWLNGNFKTKFEVR